MGLAERSNGLLRTRLAGLWVAVDVQHLYRAGSHLGDSGSVYKLANGGKATEGATAVAYASALVAWLRARGASVLTNEPSRGILTGPYSLRHHAVNAWGAHAYLACHVNAGGGNYGLAEYMVGSPGQPLGEHVGAVLRSRFDELRVFKVNPLAPGQRGAVCLEGIDHKIPAAILEPFFGDTPRMQGLFAPDRLTALGEAIGEGIATWWEKRPAK